VTEYEILTRHDNMPEGYVCKTYKWAHNDKEAVRLLLKKMPDSTGICVFKRGGTGNIISVKQI